MTVAAVKSAPGQQQRPALRDLDTTEKQILWAVKYGRKCTFNVFDFGSITGYVAGMDRYNYFVVWIDDDRIRQALIHKGSTPVVELHADATLDTEETDLLRQKLLDIISPFRGHVLKQYFHQAPSAPRA